MIFVDSSVWIDYFNGHKTWQTDRLAQLLGEELIIIGDIVLAEILQGFRNDQDFENAKKALSLLPCPNLCGIEIAVKSAVNFRTLRKRGVTIRKTVDMIIGTLSTTPPKSPSVCKPLTKKTSPTATSNPPTS